MTGGEEHDYSMQSILDVMIRCVENCLKKNGDMLLFVDTCSISDDDSHGMYAAVLTAMDAHVPQLEFAVKATCIVEYLEDMDGDIKEDVIGVSTYYSPSGKHGLHLTGGYMLYEKKATFPQAAKDAWLHADQDRVEAFGEDPQWGDWDLWIPCKWLGLK